MTGHSASQTEATRQWRRRFCPAARRPHRGLVAGALALGVVILAGTTALIGSLFQEARRSATELLGTVSEAETREVEMWLGHHASLIAIAVADTLPARFVHWMAEGAPPGANADNIKARLLELHRNTPDVLSTWIIDSSGMPVIGTSVAAEVGMAGSEPTLAAQASVQDAALRVDLHRHADSGAVHLTLVSPMHGAPRADTGALLAVVADAARGLLPLLGRWPGSTPGVESILLRRSATRIEAFGATAEGSTSPAGADCLVSADRTLHAHAIENTGEVIVQRACSGTEVLSIARPVAGTDWFVLTTLPQGAALQSAEEKSVAVLLLIVTVLSASGAIVVRGLQLRTARQRSQDLEFALKTSAVERRLGLLFRHARDIVLVTDPDGRIVDANDAAEAAYGYSRNELLRLRLQDIQPGAPMQEWTRNGDVEQGSTFESSHRRKDGSSLPVELSTRRLEIDGRDLRVAVVRDISARRAAEDALRQSEDRFRTYFERSMVGMATTSLSKGWLEVNQALCDIVGYTREEMQNLTWAEITYPDDLAADVASFERVLRDEIDGYGMEKRFIRKDGSVVDAQIAAQCVRNPDRTIAYFAAQVLDITERKRAERQLQQKLIELERMNARLEQAQNQLLQSEKMASIGQLAAGVAHELNNPIGFVHSNLGALSTYLQELFALLGAYREVIASASAEQPGLEGLRRMEQQVDVPFMQRDLLDLIVESRDGIERVTRIVRDLKDFSRPGDATWQWADLQRGLESTLNIVHNELKYKAEVVRDFGMIPRIYCLPSRLNQVFLNLLVNAGQAIEDKGVITLRSRLFGEHVEIEVRDTGKGIEPEHLPRLFEPFFTTKPVGKGTGLGLSLAYSIVQQHGGRIEVESRPGEGASFRVRLPVQPAGHAVEPVAA